MVRDMKKENGNIFSHTLGIVRKHIIFFLVTFAISFLIYSFIYGVWLIPFIDFGIMRMSEVTLFDYFFIALVSLLITSLITLMKYERLNRLKAGSKPMATAGGAIFGFVSAVCPVCQGITLIALGTTLGSIPLASLVPYIGIFQFVTVGLLFLAVSLKADSIYRKVCVACKVMPAAKNKKGKHTKPSLLRSNAALFGILVITVLLLANSLLIPKAFAPIFSSTGGTISLGKFEYGPKTTLKPMPLAQGEQPVIQGYGSKVKSIPTISELVISPSTGDAVQDVLNNVVPRGTPWYGEQAGVSFDDPIAAQNSWKKGLGIQLSADEQARWQRIVNSFTCDYCCGSPQNPTIITRCGCAHSVAAQGMAKWFIKYYGNSYSDEEIYGEMARWYAVWYPGPTVKRILHEAQA